MAEVYDRQPGETEEAWAAFWRYRDQSPRPGLAQYAGQIGRSEATVRGWATRYGWDARVLAWDQRVDRARQAATVSATEEMAQRHIVLAKKGLDIVELALTKMHGDLSGEFGRLTAQEIARLLDVCAKHERLSRGEATERVDTGADYSKFSDSELEELDAILSRKRA